MNEEKLFKLFSWISIVAMVLTAYFILEAIWPGNTEYYIEQQSGYFTAGLNIMIFSTLLSARFKPKKLK